MLRRHRLFTVGIAGALLLGAAAPAFAKPAHPTHPTHPTHPAKPPKGPKAPKPHRVNGGGVTANGAEFSVQAGNGKSKGHFNYNSADGTLHVRCKGVTLVWTAPATADVTSDNCFSLAADGTKTKVTPFSARFVDNGKGTTDVATIAINSATPTDDGLLKSGNIHVR